MKVIELLDKIANGEEVPDKIIYDNVLYKFYGCAYRDDEGNTLGQNTILDLILDKEVEIIEEDKKIENIDEEYFERAGVNLRDKILKEKINKIIDKLNEMGDK